MGLNILTLRRGLILKQVKLFTSISAFHWQAIMLGSILFTTIFLTVNHLFPIFALPPVSKDNISASQSLSLTHVLVKRDCSPAYQTCDEQFLACQSSEDWRSRNCVAQPVDRIWYDTCVDDEGDVRYRWGICPEDTICMDTYGPER